MEARKILNFIETQFEIERVVVLNSEQEQLYDGGFLGLDNEYYHAAVTSFTVEFKDKPDGTFATVFYNI